MFAAMMDGVKEESVGFLFNLEVQVDDGTGAPAEAEPAAQVGAQPQLDLSLLKAAQEEHEQAAEPEARPHIKAKGLDRTAEEKPLTYSAPELGEDGPSVRTSAGDGDGEKTGSQSATAKRQQARQNPNRGSRGNRGNSGAANRSKRKR
jgi:preprotein translocase subunit SecA